MGYAWLVPDIGTAAEDQADSGEVTHLAALFEFPKLWPASRPHHAPGGASGDFLAAACLIAACLLRPQVAERRAALAEVGVEEDW